MELSKNVDYSVLNLTVTTFRFDNESELRVLLLNFKLNVSLSCF